MVLPYRLRTTTKPIVQSFAARRRGILYQKVSPFETNREDANKARHDGGAALIRVSVRGDVPQRLSRLQVSPASIGFDSLYSVQVRNRTLVR